jgi:lipoprotein NlpD
MTKGSTCQITVRNSHLAYVFGGMLMLMLSGCANPVVPVSERDTLSVREEVELMGGSVIRIVQQGDTLYSVAFDAGIDFRQLAQWNRIGDPYIISVGQRIRLTKPDGFVTRATGSINSRSSGGSSVSSRARGTSSSTVSSRSVSGNTRSSSGSVGSSPTSWLWPVTGQVIGTYNPSVGRKGIDIAGAAGSTIKAAASGRVVYSGSGLRGYGQMLILKHSEEFLSAYAHNRRILVKEGEQVQQGQKIAELGNSGTDKYMLHFEIRRLGQPVDPNQYLPRPG